VTELEKFLAYYGHDGLHEGKKVNFLVNVIACKHVFLAFKLQATTKWGIRLVHRDLWGMITSNHLLQTMCINNHLREGL